MKKTKYILLAFLLTFLVGCSGTTYTPKVPYPGIPDAPSGGGGGGEGPGGGGEELPEEKNMVVNFYLNYSNSDEPIYTMEWYSLTPLKAIPDEAKLTDADAPDPLYPHFLGYSEYPSSIDDSHLWNFETDYKQSNVLSLYGIWVSNQKGEMI